MRAMMPNLNKWYGDGDRLAEIRANGNASVHLQQNLRRHESMNTP